VRTGSSRVTSRDGVNAAQIFFEHYGCTFQEVGQQHDFGKDAYVDLADATGITPLCVALQIKAGMSYRTAKGDYVVLVESHADLWRRSTVPVFGIVRDPDDGQLRWADPPVTYARIPKSREGTFRSQDCKRSTSSAFAERSRTRYARMVGAARPISSSTSSRPTHSRSARCTTRGRSAARSRSTS